MPTRRAETWGMGERLRACGEHRGMRRRELPTELGDVFAVRDALAGGVDASRLAAADLERPFHGVRRRSAAGAAVGHVEQARAYATRMTSHEFFSHTTAAALWGLPVPMRMPGWARAADLHVSVLSPHRAPRGRGVRGHEVDTALVSVVALPSGVRVTDPASTWAQLGAILTEPDLVAVADALIREPRRADERPALATIEQLEAAIDAGRRPGVRRLRCAIPKVRPRVDSRTETLLRLLIVDDGLPEPLTGFPVIVGGRELAQVDLAYPRIRVAIEYEGEHHLTDPGQWARDIRRYERLADAGWHVIRVTKDDLFGRPAALLHRIRRALAARS